MEPRPALHRGARQTELLHERIQGRGLRPGAYALFFVSGEGTALPISRPGDDVEETSGYVIDRAGRVYSFWFGWDAKERRADILEWEEVCAEPDWLSSPEYRAARALVGLPAP